MWKRKIKVKHLFTEKEDHESIQESMSKIADVLEKENFPKRIVDAARHISKDLPLGHANSVLKDMYDYADTWRVWIE